MQHTGRHTPVKHLRQAAAAVTGYRNEVCTFALGLGPHLQRASALDRAYFWWLLQSNNTVEFDDLVDKAEQCVPGSSSRKKLASFLGQFDEALIIEGLTPSEDLPCGSTVWETAVRRSLIHQKIRVDPDYREWVAKTLELELRSLYGA